MTNFFGPFSPYLNHPLLTEERTSAEVDQLLRILDLHADSTVLDIGCGFGRHSLGFARHGMRPTGIDPSQTMIDAARETAAAAHLSATFIVGSGEAGEAGAGGSPYDGAIAMFTTLGQVGPNNRDNLGLLATTATLLKPGAGFVIEVPQRAAAVAGLVTEDRFGDGDNRTEISRHFDQDSSRVIERFHVVAGGVAREFDLAYRLFSSEELVGHLTDAGFGHIQVAADLTDLLPVTEIESRTGRPGAGDLDPEAPTMYVAAVSVD